MKIDGDPTWGRDPQVGNRCFRAVLPKLVQVAGKKHAVIPWRANPLVVENFTTGVGG